MKSSATRTPPPRPHHPPHDWERTPAQNARMLYPQEYRTSPEFEFETKHAELKRRLTEKLKELVK